MVDVVREEVRPRHAGSADPGLLDHAEWPPVEDSVDPGPIDPVDEHGIGVEQQDDVGVGGLQAGLQSPELEQERRSPVTGGVWAPDRVSVKPWRAGKPQPRSLAEPDEQVKIGVAQD